MDYLDRVLELFRFNLSRAPTGTECYIVVKYNSNTHYDKTWCVLCNQMIHSDDQRKHHASEALHQKILADFNSEITESKSVLARLHIACSKQKENVLPRIEALASEAWRVNVKGALFSYVTTSTPTLQEEALATAMNKLLHYEHLELLVLLHLAVWKSQCVLQMPIGADVFRTEQWFTTHWKTVKSEHAESNTMAIVVSSVKPFLGPPERYESP